MLYKPDWERARKRLEAWWNGDKLEKSRATGSYKVKGNSITFYYDKGKNSETYEHCVAYGMEALCSDCCDTYFKEK